MRNSFVMLLVLAGGLLGQNSPVAVSVDPTVNRRAINPNIYGVAFGTAFDVTTLNVPLNRFGGDATSRYNWQIDAHGAGNDWYFETYSDGDGTPGKSADANVTLTRTNPGAEPLITIPMIDWLANLGTGRTTLEGFSVKKYGAQTATDPWNSDAGNGISSATSADITGNSPTDSGVANSTSIQQAWVQHFVNTFGPSTSTGGVKYYILDNEPSLWYSTHRDVHPSPSTYDEMYNKIVAYATAIRAADPNAKIVGPEEWSWWAMYLSGLDQSKGISAVNSDYSTHNNTYYYPYLLQKLYAYKQSTGQSLIDIWTVHCYNDGPGSDDSLATQLARNAQTRILWDPTFQDPSWYGDLGLINGGRTIAWIPTLRAMVNQYYPGLPIGCTEYNWGDEANLNGATTQADVLGIYGREGFDLATRWTTATGGLDSSGNEILYPTYLASQIYRNYDGKMSTFGDVSVSATGPNPDYVSTFAAQRSSDNALTVMVINKQQGSTPVTVNLANFTNPGTAQVWQINSASQTTVAQLASLAVVNNVIGTTVPSQSITLFVIPSGSAVTAPSAPTGLAATVGNGAATLTWSPAGGATSYAVKRGTVSGGPYATIATVTNLTAPSYSDSGLTNGTPYYYVVSASNTVGSSPNSAEVSATPTANPPAFTSSATASPNPVTQGKQTTITATVTCTANSLTGGTVQLIALDPNGGTAASQNFTAQSFTTNQSHTYTLALTPNLSGTYTVEVIVTGSTGQAWSTNKSAGTITVNAATYAATATANPATVAINATTAISLSVTSAIALTNGNVEIQIFNSAGTALFTYVWSPENFTAGQTLQLTTTWTPTNSVPAGTYQFQVGIFDNGWDTNYYWNSSAGPIIITTGTVSAPPAPTGLTAVPGNGQVTLTWTASSGATSYNVYRGGAASGESATAIATGITTASYTNTGLTNGTPYYYKVAAVNSGGTSGLSNEASATPQVAAPSAPTGLTAVAGNAQVKLTWTASSGAASYNVYRGTASNGESTAAIATAVTTASYTDTTVTNGTPYYYKVAAVNAGGTSGLSNEASATPQDVQTITFNNPGTQTVGTPLTLVASASSGLAVSFTSQTTSVCTVSGTPATATFLTAGTCTIQATQTGNSTYAAATPVSQSFTVNAAPLKSQTITFNNPGTQTVGTPLTLAASATSGLAVSFTSQTASVCTVSGTPATATFLTAGTCTIQATQAGNSTYAAATPVPQSFTVNAAPLKSQTITFNNPGTQTVGTPLTLVASASSGLAVSFTSQTASVCTVSGTPATATFLTAGTCTIQATQAGNSTYAAATPVPQSFTVKAATTGGPVQLSGSQILTTTSGLGYSRVSKTFSGTVSIKNISGSTIAGPFQIVFSSLTSGVTLTDATGTLSGSPYITVPGVVASLTPGQSATVSVRFSDPSMARITFTPVVYSGSFN